MCIYEKLKVTDSLRLDNDLEEYVLMSPGSSENICSDTFSYVSF